MPSARIESAKSARMSGYSSLTIYRFRHRYPYVSPRPKIALTMVSFLLRERGRQPTIYGMRRSGWRAFSQTLAAEGFMPVRLSGVRGNRRVFCSAA
jgi:hypothetical protein